MHQNNAACEFSICLVPEDTITQSIESIRDKLLVSPYRDDTPHVTLLRGITAPSEYTDEELVLEIDSILNISKTLPLSAEVTGVDAISTKHYSSTSVLALSPSAGLLSYRKQVIAELTKSNYTIEVDEITHYSPHLTIRLGVPLEGEMYSKVQQSLQFTTIIFEKWMLLRLIEVDTGRRMRMVGQ